jgi:hypothetical protein
MRYFYYNNKFVGNSLLDIIHQQKITLKDLDYDAVTEFLALGCLYTDKTFFKNLTKQVSLQDISLSTNNGFIDKSLSLPYFPQKPKNELDFDTNNDFSSYESNFINFFRDRVEYLSNYKISVDLTGGIDSRLLIAILNHFKVDFDVQFSLESAKENEIEIVNEIAELLKLNLTIIEKSDIESNEEINLLFELSDGQLDLFALHSLLISQKTRKENLYDLVITGVAGELYKDFWWQQDFPFYNKNKANLNRLFYMRFYPLLIDSHWLGKNTKLRTKDIFSSLIESFNIYQTKKNTEKYDLIYLNNRIKESLSIMTNASNKYLTVYSPYVESELLNIGYSLNRGDRFFSNFHRNIITKINPKLAAIRTTDDNMSVSNKLNHILTDTINYPINKSKKIISKLFRKKSNPSQVTFSESVIKEFDINRKVLIDIGYLSTVFPSDIYKVPKALVGRVITIGKLIQLLE